MWCIGQYPERHDETDDISEAAKAASLFWRLVPESMIRRKAPCESSPASAGMELTAGDLSRYAKRIAESPMRSESEHRRCVASTALLQHVPFCPRLCLARQNRQQTDVSVGGALLDLVDEPV